MQRWHAERMPRKSGSPLETDFGLYDLKLVGMSLEVATFATAELAIRVADLLNTHGDKPTDSTWLTP